MFVHCAVQASGAGPVPSVTAEGNLAAQVCTSTGKFKSYLESYGEGKSNPPLEQGVKTSNLQLLRSNWSRRKRNTLTVYPPASLSLKCWK